MLILSAIASDPDALLVKPTAKQVDWFAQQQADGIDLQTRYAAANREYLKAAKQGRTPNGKRLNARDKRAAMDEHAEALRRNEVNAANYKTCRDLPEYRDLFATAEVPAIGSVGSLKKPLRIARIVNGDEMLVDVGQPVLTTIYLRTSTAGLIDDVNLTLDPRRVFTASRTYTYDTPQGSRTVLVVDEIDRDAVLKALQDRRQK